MPLSGFTALVTGASGAIGSATAAVLAAQGANLAITGLEPAATEEVASRLRATGVRVFAAPVDLAVRSETRRFLADALDYFDGQIDIGVMNAGMSVKQSVLDVEDAAFDKQVEINFAAPFWLAHGLFDALKASTNPAIVFISSTGAITAHSNSAVYDAMKAGLEGLTRSLAVELGPFGVRVNAIEPGQIINGTDVPDDPTPERLAQWAAIPLGRAGQPDDIAQAVSYLVSPEAAYVTGTVVRVDGGRTARIPIIVMPTDS